MASDDRWVEERGVAQRDVIWPELMVRGGTEGLEPTHEIGNAMHNGAVRRVRQDADEAVLSHRTRRQAGVPVIGEPVMGEVVVDVVWVEERDKDVDVKE